MRASLGLDTALAAAAYLLVYLACAIAVGVRVARHLAGPDRLERAFVGTLVFAMQGIGVPLVLAMTGLLGATPVLLLHPILVAVVLAVVPSHDAVERGERDAEARWSLGIGAVLVALAVAPTVSAIRAHHVESRHP